MRFPTLCVPLLAVLALTPDAALADAAAGARKAASMCAVCHGKAGIGTSPANPNLAGQKEMYLVKQLEDFRSGARTHEQMSIIAKGLQDEDIRDLSAYYANLPPDGQEE